MKVESGVMLVNQPSPIIRVDPNFAAQAEIAQMQAQAAVAQAKEQPS